MKKEIRLPWKKPAEEITLEEPRNEYYENISANLGIFQVILYFSLLTFVFLSFLQNTNLITYRNFYYFFKDLGASAESIDTVTSDHLSYATNDEQSFTLYRQGLAVAGNNSVTIFTATGRQTLTEIISYRAPVAVGSGKYLLVYELGGKQYSLYNSYTQIHSGISEAPLLGAAVSDSGMYALISSSEEYSSVVSLYSSHFSLLNRYNKNGYVMDAAIDEKGKTVAILTSTPKDGVFESRLELYEPGKGEALASTRLSSSMALTCAFTDGGRVAALCNDGIYFAEHDGDIDRSYTFDGRAVSNVLLNGDGAVICLSSAIISENDHILAFDKNGKLLYNEAVTENAEKLARSGNTVYLLSRGKLSALNLKNGSVKTTDCYTENRTLLAVSDREVLLCSPQKAEYIRFS